MKNLPFGPQERLACLLSKAQMSNEDYSRAQEFLGNPNFSFENFQKIIDFNGVTLLALHKLPDLKICQSQKDKIKRIKHVNFTRRFEFLELLTSFNAEKIPVYILKGFLLGELVYKNYSYKKMNDIDILISREYIHKALKIFNSCGYNFACENLLGKKAIDFRLHHSPPLIKHQSNTIIGLHWGLLSPLALRHPTTDIFINHKIINIENSHAHMLSYEYNLLHLCIHLPFFKIGLRELADIANLGLFGAYEINWPFFFEIAKKAKALDAVYRLFCLSDALIPWLNKEVKKELLSIKNNFAHSPYIKDTDLRIANPGILIRSRSTYLGKIEKNFILFKLAKNYNDKAFHLKEQWRLFFKIPAEEKERLLIFNKSRIFKSSRLLWFALAQDLGSYFLTLITLNNLFLLFKARIKKLFKKEEVDKNIVFFRDFMEHIE